MRYLAAVGVFVLSASSAFAAPITYTHTGFGSGTLNGQTFGALAPVAFTIVSTSDTSTVASCGGACIYNDNLTSQITIGGMGTFTILTGTRYFDNLGIVGYSRAGASGNDLFNGPALVWNMTTSVGPIVGTGQLLQWGLVPNINTSGGILFFNPGSTDSTFTATVGPIVPEPATLVLVGTGLAAALRRRFSARA